MKRISGKTVTPSTKDRRPSFWPAALRYVSMTLGAVIVVGAFYWLYFGVLGNDLPKTALYRSRSDYWQSKLGVIRHKLDVYEDTLDEIEERNDLVYRTIFALEPLRDSIRTDSTDVEVKFLENRLEAARKRIDLQVASLGEVALVAKEAGDMVSHIPAVPPILPKKGTYHLSSPFGTRTDPVYGGTAHHMGQDFASSLGNPVYATGDGVVEKVDFKYSGYGNEVIINHGFGYKTRYAHLNTVDVGVGQPLKRGDRIGDVGKSGKVTGPHLHYEVLFKGNQVNPMSFMDMEMPVDEYKAMIGKRTAEAAAQLQGGPPSAATMGERQRKQGTSGRQ